MLAYMLQCTLMLFIHAPVARVHIAGSSAEYGPLSPEEVPVKEV